MNNPIERLAARLQVLPAEVRWLYVQEDVIQAEAFGLAPVRGPRASLADRLIAVTRRLGMARFAAVAINATLLLALYVRQHLLASERAAPAAVFVGIHALREPALMRQFGELQGRSVLHLDERGLDDFYRHGRVTWPDLWREMRMVWREVWDHLSQAQPSVLSKKYVLAFFLMRGHSFAFLRAWFRNYLRQADAAPVVACSAASYVCHAPVAAGAQTIYMLHGFQRHSIVLPDFAQCICFAGFEAAHLRRRLPECNVTLMSERARQIETCRVAAIAGSYETDGSDLIRPFIDWARRNSLPVIVRKHPADHSTYWDQWRGVDEIEIVEAEGSFNQFLEDVRPRFLACWYSTALLDGLLKGIVPVTVMRGNSQSMDIVFPFRDISLCWPEDEKLAQALLDDAASRASFISRKYSYVMSEKSASSPCDKARLQSASET